jgi:hypothetical protein
VKKIRTITSYAENARWWAEVEEEPIGFIPRQNSIPSPYAYSPVHIVYKWDSKPVIQVETKHKYYEVYDVSHMTIHKDEENAIRCNHA